MKKVPAWVILCVIALVAGAALGTTNALTKGPIAEQAARAAEAARAAVLPAAERFEQVEVAEGAPVDNCYQGVDASGNAVGYVAQVTVTGFGGPIEVTVGVNAEGELTGIQCGGSGFSETAGLGAKVKETAFSSQFAGLATPVAIMVGNGMGAKHGTMFKTAVSLEETGKTQIVALDKTGTITSGEPQVTDLVPADGVSEEELLKGAFALEQKSEHPLARAILALAEEKGLAREEVSDFSALPGNGLVAKRNGKELCGGNRALITKKAVLAKQMEERAAKLSEEGKTPLFFSEDGKMLGMIAVADVIKEDSPRAVKELQNMGIRVVMLTGDNERTARAIGAQAGVDEVIAGVLPDGKEAVISRLKEKGKVAMVGDGINDAPALTSADIGIAIGAGTDIAIDAADVVLMKSRLSDVPAAIRLSRADRKSTRLNSSHTDISRMPSSA